MDQQPPKVNNKMTETTPREMSEPGAFGAATGNPVKVSSARPEKTYALGNASSDGRAQVSVYSQGRLSHTELSRELQDVSRQALGNGNGLYLLTQLALVGTSETETVETGRIPGGIHCPQEDRDKVIAELQKKGWKHE